GVSPRLRTSGRCRDRPGIVALVRRPNAYPWRARQLPAAQKSRPGARGAVPAWSTGGRSYGRRTDPKSTPQGMATRPARALLPEAGTRPGRFARDAQVLPGAHPGTYARNALVGRQRAGGGRAIGRG